MMSRIFIEILNMSISASYIVLAVIVFRFVLKKASKWISVLLWGIVGVRLILPFSIESALSLIPSANTVSPDIITAPIPTINSGIPIINSTINPIISENLSPTLGDSANPLQIWIPIVTLVWAVGIIAMLIYTAVSYARISRRVRCAVLLRDNIYQSERVSSPFVLGIIKPRIYLPFDISEENASHVIAHENAHVRRRDHIWKPLGFLLLTIHWFNPLMWLGYVLLSRDIELACDEKVIKELDRDARADYSEALLSCSINRKMIAACPLAFGEVGVKGRIKSVLSYKKPTLWIIIVAILVCIAVAICFLTDPPEEKNSEIYTDYEGVYISLEEIVTIVGKCPAFIVQWHNETNKTVTFGEIFGIEFKSGDTWIDTATKDVVFGLTGRILPPHSKTEMIYYAENFDLSNIGDYRFSTRFTVEGKEGKVYRTRIKFEAHPNIPLTDLSEKYPDYFDIDASKGLDVYVWEMAEGLFHFGLLPHSEKPRDFISSELMNLRGATPSEMSVILSSYNISKNDINIIPWQNPLSSYISEYFLGNDEEKKSEYIEKLKSYLFNYIPIFSGAQHVVSTVYDTAIFDFDGDGKKEICSLSHGLTSGLFSFFFTAREIEANENDLKAMFITYPFDLSFETGDDGITRVKAVKSVLYGDTTETHYFDISVKDGEIVLTENGVPITEIVKQ